MGTPADNPPAEQQNTVPDTPGHPESSAVNPDTQPARAAPDASNVQPNVPTGEPVAGTTEKDDAKDAPQGLADLSADQTDAILRDPNVPGDVRVSVLASYEVRRYLDTHEFYEDQDGVTHSRVREDA